MCWNENSNRNFVNQHNFHLLLLLRFFFFILFFSFRWYILLENFTPFSIWNLELREVVLKVDIWFELSLDKKKRRRNLSAKAFSSILLRNNERIFVAYIAVAAESKYNVHRITIASILPNNMHYKILFYIVSGIGIWVYR